MISKFKRIVRSTQYSLNDAINYYNDTIRVDWYGGDNNFGDILNPIVISHLTEKKILSVRSKYCKKKHLLAIGSILDRATKSSIVWGSGFISLDSSWIEKPNKIYAVRGPKTRKKLIDAGAECPEVYGDPALLMPYIYQPKNRIKKYKLGIIPHIVDKNHDWLDNYKKRCDVIIIDVQNPNPLQVIDQIVSCEKVISSSLHGLIVSDAYRIPSLWIKFSDNLKGGDFKFFDYFLSVGRKDKLPIVIGSNINADDVIETIDAYEISIDMEKLINSFPAEENF